MKTLYIHGDIASILHRLDTLEKANVLVYLIVATFCPFESLIISKFKLRAVGLI